MNGKTFDLVLGEDVVVDVPPYAEVGDHIMSEGDLLKIYEISGDSVSKVALTKFVKKVA